MDGSVIADKAVRSFDQHKLKLGLFGLNCSGGLSATLVPERWQGTWQENLAIAQMADEAGLDFLLPLGRWKGYGGETDHNGGSLETLTWACGILAATKHIMAFGTVHVPLFNPIVAAKQMVTADQIGGGRFGLNIVCGWNLGEFNMAGVELNAHEARYEQGQEWVDIVTKAWTSDEPFDYAGDHYSVKGALMKPKPVSGDRPLVVSAGNSDRGREFAARNSDMMFTGIRVDQEEISDDIAPLKAQAKSYGREIGIFTNCYVVCRPTRKEAEEYHDYYALEMADHGAVDNLIAGRSARGRFDELPEAMLRNLKQRAGGGNGAYPIVGDADDVANLLIKLNAAGIDAFAMGMANYLEHFPFFRDEVLPRLEAAGVR
jgi:FMNH2-dependent dimethyl sulfone monooxygenase